MTKYLRVVLAYNDENKALIEAALEHLIEADTMGAPSMGVTGAHISAPYDTREEACGPNFVNRQPLTEEESDAVCDAAVKLEEEMTKYYSGLLWSPDTTVSSVADAMDLCRAIDAERIENDALEAYETRNQEN
jgi:hypothetical protein